MLFPSKTLWRKVMILNLLLTLLVKFYWAASCFKTYYRSTDIKCSFSLSVPLPASVYRHMEDRMKSDHKLKHTKFNLQYYYCQLMHLDVLCKSSLKGLPTIFSPLTKWSSLDDVCLPSCFPFITGLVVWPVRSRLSTRAFLECNWMWITKVLSLH